MRTFSYFIITCFLLPFAANGQKKGNGNSLKALLRKQEVKISDTSFMSRYEVSNQLYNFFLADLKKTDPSKFSIAKVDSLKWNEKRTENAMMAKYYNSHPSYNNFPVVNISYEGAILFCKWLKEKYATDLKVKVKEIRLPTLQEWEAAAKAGHSDAVYSWKGIVLFDEKGQPYGQYKGAEEAMTKPGKLSNSWKYTAPVSLFQPNAFGLYNMCGNVAEMLGEKGHTKGGAWDSSGDYLKITGPDEFANIAEPSPFIGFRYIIIVEKATPAH
jgi:formylglycine-generating enzyme required for sulfatase activity